MQGLPAALLPGASAGSCVAPSLPPLLPQPDCVTSHAQALPHPSGAVHSDGVHQHSPRPVQEGASAKVHALDLQLHKAMGTERAIPGRPARLPAHWPVHAQLGLCHGPSPGLREAWKQELQRHRETGKEKAIPAGQRFFCPNTACARALTRRGSSRRVTCRFCSAVVRLPWPEPCGGLDHLCASQMAVHGRLSAVSAVPASWEGRGGASACISPMSCPLCLLLSRASSHVHPPGCLLPTPASAQTRWILALLQVCCTCRGPWHGKQPCSTAVLQQPGRPELANMARTLNFTRCDVCGAAVERTEVSLPQWGLPQAVRCTF